MQIRRSIWITFAWSNASTIAMFTFSLVLARILTPAEIGVFSLCMVVINMTSVFRDLGTNPYLIRKGEVSHEDIGSVLGLTLTTSWVLALALWFGRDVIARYFGEPLMAQVLPVLLLGFLMIPVSGVMMTMLVRNLSAGRSALVALVATICYGSTVLGLALTGYGALAPAWANVANIFSSLVVVCFLMPKGFRLLPRWSGWGAPIRFSGGVVLTNLSSTAYNSVPDAFIGRAMGATEVGLFSRANGTVGLFQQVVGPTLNYNALPIIAKTFHDSPDAMVAMLMRSNAMLTVVAWPVYAWIAFFPAEIIGLLYGPTWVPAALLVPWLCLAAAARTPIHLVGAALQAVNRPFSTAMASVAGLLLRVAVLTLISVKDLHQFVVWLCVADLLGVCVWALVARKGLSLGLRAFLFSQRRSFVVTISCVGALVAVRLLLCGLDSSPFFAVAASGSTLAVVWVAGLMLTKHPFGDELKNAWSRFRS